MATEPNRDFVTSRELADKIDALRRETKLWVALGLVGGQVVASLVTAYVTHLSPPHQATAALHLVAALF